MGLTCEKLTIDLGRLGKSIVELDTSTVLCPLAASGDVFTAGTDQECFVFNNKGINYELPLIDVSAVFVLDER